MINNEVQYRATKAHLERFEAAAANIEARPGKRTSLERLELDAVRAKADDLRSELADFDLLREDASVNATNSVDTRPTGMGSSRP